MSLLPGRTRRAPGHGADAVPPREPGLRTGGERPEGAAHRERAASPGEWPSGGGRARRQAAIAELAVMSDRLLVRSAPVPDPGEGFCRQIPVPAALAWIRQGAGLVGWGEAARVTLPAGADRFADGEKWLRELIDGAQVDDEVRRRGSGLVAFGSFTFDDASDGSVLMVPRAILGRDGTGNAWLTTITPDGETPWQPGPVRSSGAAGHRQLARRGAVARSGSRPSARRCAGSSTRTRSGRSCSRAICTPPPTARLTRGRCSTGWPAGTRAATRSPATAWSAPPPSC